MHAQAKQTNKLRGSYNEGVKPGRNRTDRVAMDQRPGAGSDASSGLNLCIIWVLQYALEAVLGVYAGGKASLCFAPDASCFSCFSFRVHPSLLAANKRKCPLRR